MQLDKVKAFDALAAIDQLRVMEKAFSCCRESFLQQFSFSQLQIVYRAWLACDWSIWPDAWSSRQVSDALAGYVPQFEESSRAPGGVVPLVRDVAARLPEAGS